MIQIPHIHIWKFQIIKRWNKRVKKKRMKLILYFNIIFICNKKAFIFVLNCFLIVSMDKMETVEHIIKIGKGSSSSFFVYSIPVLTCSMIFGFLKILSMFCANILLYFDESITKGFKHVFILGIICIGKSITKTNVFLSLLWSTSLSLCVNPTS